MKFLCIITFVFVLFVDVCGLETSESKKNVIFSVYPVYEEPVNPCHPSPCGPNSICKPHNYDAVCSCLPNYIGRAPNCRPECTMDSDCPTSLACICDRCQNPCDGTCAANAHCTVLYHRAHCVCNEDYIGDPYSGCSRVVLCKIFSSVESKKQEIQFNYLHGIWSLFIDYFS